jgi:hypothetical protein
VASPVPEAHLVALAAPEATLLASPVPEALPLCEDDGPLTPCTACGRSIAKRASACPNCGAPNEWVHPEIVRFYRSIDRFEFEKCVKITYEKFVLCGVDQGSNRDALGLAKLAGSFRVAAPLSINGLATVMAVGGGQDWLHNWAQKKLKAFRIDFTNLPPGWASTDDEYWLDVMKFFGIPRPKKKSQKKR